MTKSKIMQKKIIITICFIALVVGLVWVSAWYESREEQKSNDAQSQAGASLIAQEKQAQNTIMQNLKITDDVVGTGAEAKNGDTVTVNYVGTLDNGTKFDSSYDRNQPFSFTLGATGAGAVIKGWNLGVVGMKVGGKRDLVIPPELGYGASGYGPVPGNATLHFTVELLSIGTSSTSAAEQ
jgi:FKBP-type peptidyl-prolyl cis-trans isomerase